MQNQMMMMLMNQLKARNPQFFQMINQARQNNSNPQELYKEITSKYTPEQMQKFTNFAKQFGFSEEQLNQLNGINTK